MQTLTQTQPEINTPSMRSGQACPHWYVASIAREALAAAEAYFVQYPGLAWETVCYIYLTVFGQKEEVDLSQTTIPAAPDINEWLASLEAGEVDDRLAAMSQQYSGIPTF